jgi:hypothetical protein
MILSLPFYHGPAGYCVPSRSPFGGGFISIPLGTRPCLSANRIRAKNRRSGASSVFFSGRALETKTLAGLSSRSWNREPFSNLEITRMGSSILPIHQKKAELAGKIPIGSSAILK